MPFKILISLISSKDNLYLFSLSLTCQAIILKFDGSGFFWVDVTVAFLPFGEYIVALELNVGLYFPSRKIYSTSSQEYGYINTLLILIFFSVILIASCAFSIITVYRLRLVAEEEVYSRLSTYVYLINESNQIEETTNCISNLSALSSS